jgi:hypothetical protein
MAFLGVCEAVLVLCVDQGMNIPTGQRREERLYLLIHHVPYVTPEKQVSHGILVSRLDLSEDRTSNPKDHDALGLGEFPCKSDGSKMRLWSTRLPRRRFVTELSPIFYFRRNHREDIPTTFTK